MVRMQMTLRAESLKKVGLTRVGSPYATVVVTGGPNEGKELGRTEVLENDLNPDWATIIFVEAESSVYMPIKIAVKDKKDDRVMAEGNFEVTEIHESPGHQHFQQNENGSKVWAHVTQSIVGGVIGQFDFHFRGLDIKNIEAGVLGLGRSDPFYEICKKSSDLTNGVTTWPVAYRSETIMDNLNPYWKEGSLSLEALCYGDLEWPLKISVWDWQSKGRHRVIGEVETTIQDIVDHVTQRGNADREGALKLSKVGGTKIK
eukprot:CAMPEP_0194058144 /NCGR_PEP_ID=MMETSP0009_2-20130614/65318_1 /TAXON_ID=210454 /ORGANISM="Grammatophora oceanica, Strain CCMP 410" /LENGTH=258 /DNA_ID=CAMNT_0038708153 /DNA_START=77 /DNA_END=850 /DNA_ORIENTATION=-